MLSPWSAKRNDNESIVPVCNNYIFALTHKQQSKSNCKHSK